MYFSHCCGGRPVAKASPPLRPGLKRGFRTNPLSEGGTEGRGGQPLLPWVLGETKNNVM
jgi:hypothetical protein